MVPGLSRSASSRTTQQEPRLQEMICDFLMGKSRRNWRFSSVDWKLFKMKHCQIQGLKIRINLIMTYIRSEDSDRSESVPKLIQAKQVIYSALIYSCNKEQHGATGETCARVWSN